jgi:hypothetical protein
MAKDRIRINLKAYELSLLDADVASREKEVERCEKALAEAKSKLANAKYKLSKYSEGVSEGDK